MKYLKQVWKKRHWYTISIQFQYIRHITQCIVDLGAVSCFDGVVNAGGGGGGGGEGGGGEVEMEVVVVVKVVVVVEEEAWTNANRK